MSYTSLFKIEFVLKNDIVQCLSETGLSNKYYMWPVISDF